MRPGYNQTAHQGPQLVYAVDELAGEEAEQLAAVHNIPRASHTSPTLRQIRCCQYHEFCSQSRLLLGIRPNERGYIDAFCLQSASTRVREAVCLECTYCYGTSHHTTLAFVEVKRC